MKKVLIITASLLLLAPVLVRAQVVSPTAVTPPTATAYGNGDSPTLDYFGQAVPTNQFVFATGYQFSYDDNVVALAGSSKKSDEVNDINAQVKISHLGPRWTTSIEYVPFYEFYNEFSQYNRLNQHMVADINAKLNQRWSLRIRDNFDDLTSPSGSSVNSGSGSPSGLNPSIFVPLAAEQGNNARVDLVWQPNGRNSAFIYGSYENRDFTQIITGGNNLINTRGPNTGAEYTWLPSEHTAIGALYLFSRLDFSGALPVGSPERLDIHGFLPSMGWRPSATMQITAFGGVEFANQTIAPVTPSTARTYKNQVLWAAGGSIAGQRNRTSWYIVPQRLVTDGGGYFSFVVSTSVNAAVRQQLPLPGRWDATINFLAAKNEAFAGQSNSLNLNAQTASVGVEHLFTQSLRAQARYDFIHQTNSNSAPINAEFDRNRVAVGIYYQWTAISQRR
ncbi:MAG TPA: hypothetical protein VF392_13405 [Terracidiphilus sp.]